MYPFLSAIRNPGPVQCYTEENQLCERRKLFIHFCLISHAALLLERDWGEAV